MSEPYAHRTKPRPPGKRRMTARDQAVLAFIATYQPVTTDVLCQRFEVSKDIGRRIARKLRDFGYIKVWVECLERENRYTLKEAGRKLLGNMHGVEPDTYHLPRRLLGGLDHHDGAVRLAVAFRLACERTGWLALEEVVLERQIRAKVGSQVTGTQIPDAVFVCTLAHGRLALSVEIDTGSENPSYLVRHKAEPYAMFQEKGVELWGCRSWRVVCIVPSKRRLHRLVKAFYEADCLPEGLWFFAVSDDLTDRNVLTSEPWLTLQIEGEMHARLVATSPLEECQ